LGKKLPMRLQLPTSMVVALFVAAPALAATLEAERKSELFTFFQLEPSCQPTPADEGRTWHCFRPSGAKFEPLAELVVLTDDTGRIVGLRLGLARMFVDHATDGVFARDLAKGFLSWAIANPVPDEAAGLIRNIADFSSAGASIDLRDPQRGRPRPDGTGGYDVYLGRSDRVDILLPHARVTLTNVAGPLPSSRTFAVDARANTVELTKLGRTSSWLAIDVAQSAVGAGTSEPPKSGVTFPEETSPPRPEQSAPTQLQITSAIIAEVQDRLYNMNYNPGAINGRIGRDTMEALRQFQQKAGLPVTGEIDSTVLAFLRGAKSAQYWGAVAFHPKGGYAAVWRRSSRREAEQEALDDCKRRAGRGCKVVVGSGTRCLGLAVASGRTGRARQMGSFGVVKPSLSEARIASVEYCRLQSGVPDTCEVRTVICADGSHGS
jgi:peptidoglycan hydrolase-like protein with peptidoglycan-binding domain